MPAYKSRIGPAFLANCGSFGKSQCSCCQGLIADSCNIRHAVLRLIFLLSVDWARRTRSASDCRLRGSSVSAIISHAIAWINAWSSGGKNGLSPASWLVFNGEITGSPAASPSLNLPSGQTHLLGRLVVFHVRLLVKQQRKPESLHDLDSHGSAPDSVQSHLHEIGGESTRSGAWSWHSGVLSVPGFFGEFISFYKKSAVTTTLIVKRTTKVERVMQLV